jgi:hypothetical protein
MWRRVNVVRTDVSEGCVASIIMVEKIHKVEKLLDVKRVKKYPSEKTTLNVGSCKIHNSATSQKTPFCVLSLFERSFCHP